jgi:DNA-binding transcriptional ArsR family regulator
VSARGPDRTLAALADPHRRLVVDLLRERPYRAGDLAHAARISFPAMSRHLRMLRQSGLVEEDRDELDSRVRIYRLKAEAMADLKTWLAETDALWARQLASFKAHLQKAKK